MIRRGIDLDILASHRGCRRLADPLWTEYGRAARTRRRPAGPRRGGRGLPRSAVRLLAWCMRRPRAACRVLGAGTRERLTASVSLLGLAAQLVDGGPYDVVHAQFGTLGCQVALHRELGFTRARLVTSFRGRDATAALAADPRCYQRLFRAGDLFLPVSESLKAAVVRAGCDVARTTVLHSGVVCAGIPFRERRLAAGETVKVLSVGRLVEKKGLDDGVRAVADLLTTGVPIVYDVVGEGPLGPRLRRLTRRLRVTRQVRFLGAQSHAEVIRLMGAAHLYLAPSRTAADGDAEGIPNALKEAMASGMPVVSTRHGGIPELVEDGVNGYIVPELSPEGLVRALTPLVRDPSAWPTLGRRARAAVEARFEAESLNERLVALYGALPQVWEHRRSGTQH